MKKESATVIYAMGLNGYGQLGLKHTEKVREPTEVTFFHGTPLLAFITGGYHNIFQTFNGLYGFGQNKHGQLGLGGFNSTNDTPTKMSFFDGHNVRYIACGEDNSMVLTDKGLYGFGKNEGGSVGIPQNSKVETPTLIEHFDRPCDIKMMALGSFHGLVLTTKGLFTVGDQNPNKNRESFDPKLVDFPFFNDIIKMGTASAFSLVTTRKHGVWGWGSNTFGQIGVPPRNMVQKPSEITFFDTHSVIHTSVATAHTMFHTSLGLFGCGWGHRSRFGLNNTASLKTPKKLTFFDSKQILEVFAMAWSNLVLTTEGLYAMGGNQHYELGIPVKADVVIPTLIPFYSKMDFKSLVLDDAEILFLLLKSRTFDPVSPFHKDALPLDLFKLITQDYAFLGNFLPARK